jgi:hypothetical protein
VKLVEYKSIPNNRYSKLSVLEPCSNETGIDSFRSTKWIGRNGVEKPGARDRFFHKTTGTWKAIMLGFDRDEYNEKIEKIELDINRISSLVGDIIELDAPRRERNRSANTRFWSLI